jgi:two-component SAPR family response regulator
MHVVQIEDDKPLKEILKVTLEAAEPKLKLNQFISGDEALPYIRQNLADIDLIIVDIRLPGELTGVQVAEIIRKLNYTGNLVLTSAYSRPNSDVLKSLQSDFYPKPWHIIDITNKILRLKLSNRGLPRKPRPQL